MPYKVIGDEVSLLRQLSEYRDPDSGRVLGVDNESVIRFKDEILADEDLSPVVIAAYERGEPHIRSMIVRLDAKGRPMHDPPAASESEAEPESLRIVSKEGTGEVKNTPIPEGEVPTPKKPKSETST